MNKCARCGKETRATIMSMFNTDILCMECKGLEEKDPRYQEARDADVAAIRRGDYNFPGIGSLTPAYNQQSTVWCGRCDTHHRTSELPGACPRREDREKP